MTKRNDTTKAGFVAAQPVSVTPAEWTTMQRRFLVASHKHHDLDTYWSLHDKLLSTPAPSWQALAFKSVLVAIMTAGLPDPSDPEEREHVARQASPSPAALSLLRLYDAALAAGAGGPAEAVDEAISSLARDMSLLDPCDRANTATIAAAEASVRPGAVNPSEINRALLAMHFDATALAKAPPAEAPAIDTRTLAERLAEARKLRDQAEDMPFNGEAEDGWDGAPVAREADTLETEIDLAPCRSREDAAAKLGAVLDVIMRKDGDLQDASGSEAKSLRSVLAYLQRDQPPASPQPGGGCAVAIAEVAAAHRALSAAADEPDEEASVGVRAVKAAESRLATTRANSIAEVAFKLRASLLAADPRHTDFAFPDPTDPAAYFGAWAADEESCIEQRLVASAILDLASMDGLAGREPAPAQSDAVLLALAPEFERRWSAQKALSGDYSDEDYNALDFRTREVVDQILDHEPETLAGLQLVARAVAWANGGIDEAISCAFEGAAPAERGIRLLLSALLTGQPAAAVSADDAELLALAPEFERRYAIEQGFNDRTDDRSDEEAEAAVDSTAEIASQIIAIPAKTLAGFRLKARLLHWASNGALFDDHPLDTLGRFANAVVGELLAVEPGNLADACPPFPGSARSWAIPLAALGRYIQGDRWGFATPAGFRGEAVDLMRALPPGGVDALCKAVGLELDRIKAEGFDAAEWVRAYRALGGTLSTGDGRAVRAIAPTDPEPEAWRQIGELERTIWQDWPKALAVANLIACSGDLPDDELVSLAVRFQANRAEFYRIGAECPHPEPAEITERREALSAALQPIIDRSYELCATTMRGLWAKALMAEEFGPEIWTVDYEDLDWKLVRSVFADIIALGERSGDPVSLPRQEANKRAHEHGIDRRGLYILGSDYIGADGQPRITRAGFRGPGKRDPELMARLRAAGLIRGDGPSDGDQ